MGELIESKMDDVLAEYSYDKLEMLPTFQRTLKLAVGIRKTLEMIEPHMDDLLSLKGTKLGFLVDKDNYDRGILKRILVEGLLRGAMPYGNEINVIGGNLYLTKEYFHRRLGELPGMTNLRVEFGLPQILKEPRWEQGEAGSKGKSVPGSALIEISATWTRDGVPGEMACCRTETKDTRIPIRLDSYYSIDQILGKAESKLLRRIYKRLTGSEWVKEDEDDIIPALPQQAEDPEPVSDAMLADIFGGIESKEEVERQREVLCSLHQGEGEQYMISAHARHRIKELRG